MPPPPSDASCVWIWPSEAAALAGLHPFRSARWAEDRVVDRLGGWSARPVRCRWGCGRRREWEARLDAGLALEGEVLRRLGATDPQRVAQWRDRGGRWGLSGRLDGWVAEVPVEVKVRMERVRAPQLHDYVQIQCYLHMLARPRCLLLAQASRAAPGEVRRSYIVRSRSFWEGTLRPRLEEAADRVRQRLPGV